MRSPRRRDVNCFVTVGVTQAVALHMSWLVYPKEGYMSIRHAFSLIGALIGATLLSFAAVAFADDNDTDSPVTLVGCIMRESDWRAANDLTRGGWLNTSAGVGNEYMLLNAVPGPVDHQTAAQANCENMSGGQTIELKGKGERRRNFESFVGQRIEVSGSFAHSHTAIVDGQIVQFRRGAVAATDRGGPVNPRKRDLRLNELKVDSFREIPIVQETVGILEVEPEAAPAPAPEPAPAPAPEPQVQQPAPAAPYTPPVALPKTASPMELMGLLGLLSMGGAFGLRTWRLR